MSVVLLLLTNSSLSFSDSHTSQFKPHPSSGKYSAIACRSSGNNAPIQFSGNAGTAARTFLSPSEIIGGNLRSNVDIKISGNGFVNGDAIPAPSHNVNKTGNATVTGSIQPATELLDCSIGDLAQLISWVQQNNNNSSIPSTNQGRMPWGCGSNPPPNDPWQFCLKGNETIHLSGGTYWFSSWSQSGNSKIIIDGYVRILVTGSIGLSGNISINADGDPYNFLIFAIPDSSFSLQMSGNTIFNGLMYGPAISAQFSGQSTINGNLISQDINASGQAKFYRWIDQTAPQITFVAPTATCLNSQNVNVSITIIDNESGIDPENISLSLDGNPVAVTANPADSFWHSVNVTASLTQIPGGSHILTAAVYDRAGNSSQASQTIIVDTIPPVLGITFPANGATVQTTNILVTGNVEDDFAEQCGLSLRVNDTPVVIQSDGSWYAAIILATSGDPQPITAVATDGSGNIATEQIFLTYSTFMPALPANIKPGIMKVDAQQYCPSPGHCSNGNGIFEPEETVIVEPSWEYIGGTPQGFTNHAGSWSGPQDGTQYIIVRDKADYALTSLGSNIVHCDPATDCYILALDPDQSPHRDAWLTENFSNGSIYTWTIHLGKSFTDVPVDSPYYRDVETMLHHGLTSGCGGLQYCPDSNLTRWELAIMLARAMAGGDANIPNSGSISIPGTGISNYNCSSVSPSSLFQDIQPTDFYCRYVHYLFKYGVTSGCSAAPRNYCPNSSVSRLELAALVARALTYSDSNIPMSYTDPITNLSYDCTAGSQGSLQFIDVPKGSTFCRHVYYLWAKNAVGGCAPNSFCSSSLATRIQIAKVLAGAFDLDLYTPLSRHTARPPGVAPCKWGSTHFSWGGYDLLSDPNNTNLCGIIGEPMNDGAECFRTFVNYCEKPNLCKFTYPLDGSGGYDLTKWDEDDDGYWARVKSLMDCSVCGSGRTYKKAVFSLGHTYQCLHDPGPWCNNNNKYGEFMHSNNPDIYCSGLPSNCSGINIDIEKNWIVNWNNTDTESICKREWIKCEYKRLAKRLASSPYGADVFEIYNEASIYDPAHPDSTAYLNATIEAHHRLIEAVKAGYQGISANLRN